MALKKTMSCCKKKTPNGCAKESSVIQYGLIRDRAEGRT